MFKKIIFGGIFGISILSCESTNRETQKVECIVISCRNVKEVISVHDEINRNNKRWEIRTTCGGCFFSPIRQNVGDTLEILIEKGI